MPISDIAQSMLHHARLRVVQTSKCGIAKLMFSVRPFVRLVVLSVFYAAECSAEVLWGVTWYIVCLL